MNSQPWFLRKRGKASDGRPLFIPASRVRPDQEYIGYEASAEGLHHWETTLTRGSYVDETLRTVPLNLVAPAFEAEPSRKRTPEERTESLAKRLAYHFDKYGLSESLVQELVAIGWKAGNALTSEEARALAAKFLGNAETDWEDEQRKHVTRRDPHVVDGAPRWEPPEPRRPGVVVTIGAKPPAPVITGPEKPVIRAGESE